MFHSLVLLWSCVLTCVLSDKVLPPENVRLSWSNGLYYQMFWTDPKDFKPNCSYVIRVFEEKGSQNPVYYPPKSSPWTSRRLMKGGFVNVSIETVCGDRSSEAVFVGVDDPDLGLSCVIMSSRLTRCSWKAPPSAHISFFYSLAKLFSSDFDELRECRQYNSTRTACDLKVNENQHMRALLNGTLRSGTLSSGTISSGTVRNIHYIPSLNMRLAPLDWTVTESKEKFVLNWIAPESNLTWRYFINCTACGNATISEEPAPPVELKRVAECPYHISLRGMVHDESRVTEWTPLKSFDAAAGMNPMWSAAIVVPLVLAVLVVLVLCWWMKNKDKIFPKVPQPKSELFKELMNNNNKVNMSDIDFSKAEEECPVTLVFDSKQMQL